MRFFKHLGTLRSLLLIIVLLCWLLPTLILGLFMGTRISVTLQEKTQSALRSQIEHGKNAAARNIEAVTALARNVVYDNEVYSAFQAHQEDKTSYETSFRIIRGYLDQKFSREPHCTFALFLPLGDRSSGIYTTKGYDLALRFIQQDRPPVKALLETTDTYCYFASYAGRSYLVRNLHNTRMERYGMLVIGVDMQSILSPLLQSAQQWNAQSALTLDDYHQGNFLQVPDGEGLFEVNSTLCYTQKVLAGDSGLRFQIQANKYEIYREMYTFRLLMVWLFVLLIPLYIGIMLFVNRRIVRPITLLSDASDRIRGGELGVVVPMRGKDELGRLGVAFSDMSLQIKDLIEKSYKEEIALRDTQIQALQSRINPHFLNNALEIVNWQARLNDDQMISKMIETLSVLLNASLDRHNRHLVPLREELNIADAYLYFVSLQFGDKLHLERHVDQSLLGVRVPPLAIQTLLENAVAHGIALAGGGFIKLVVFSSQSQLMIEVINNGPVLTKEDLVRIGALLDDDGSANGHVGIRNINQRLKLIFGDRAGLRLTVGPHGETIATIRQPLDHPPKAGHDEIPT